MPRARASLSSMFLLLASRRDTTEISNMQDAPDPIEFVGRVVDDHCWILTQARHTGSEANAKPVVFYSLIDTGASTCGVSERLARKLGLPKGKAIIVEGASGATESWMVRLKVDLHLLSGEFAETSIDACVFAGDKADLVIGMSELLKGNFELDGPRGVWSWTVEPNRL